MTSDLQREKSGLKWEKKKDNTEPKEKTDSPKTVVCQNFRQYGECPKGDKCTEAHGLLQLAEGTIAGHVMRTSTGFTKAPLKWRNADVRYGYFYKPSWPYFHDISRPPDSDISSSYSNTNSQCSYPVREEPRRVNVFRRVVGLPPHAFAGCGSNAGGDEDEHNWGLFIPVKKKIKKAPAAAHSANPQQTNKKPKNKKKAQSGNVMGPEAIIRPENATPSHHELNFHERTGEQGASDKDDQVKSPAVSSTAKAADASKDSSSEPSIFCDDEFPSLSSGVATAKPMKRHRHSKGSGLSDTSTISSVGQSRCSVSEISETRSSNSMSISHTCRSVPEEDAITNLSLHSLDSCEEETETAIHSGITQPIHRKGRPKAAMARKQKEENAYWKDQGRQNYTRNNDGSVDQIPMTKGQNGPQYPLMGPPPGYVGHHHPQGNVVYVPLLGGMIPSSSVPTVPYAPAGMIPWGYHYAQYANMQAAQGQGHMTTGTGQAAHPGMIMLMPYNIQALHSHAAYPFMNPPMTEPRIPIGRAYPKNPNKNTNTTHQQHTPEESPSASSSSWCKCKSGNKGVIGRSHQHPMGSPCTSGSPQNEGTTPAESESPTNTPECGSPQSESPPTSLPQGMPLIPSPSASTRPYGKSSPPSVSADMVLEEPSMGKSNNSSLFISCSNKGDNEMLSPNHSPSSFSAVTAEELLAALPECYED